MEQLGTQSNELRHGTYVLKLAVVAVDFWVDTLFYVHAFGGGILVTTSIMYVGLKLCHHRPQPQRPGLLL